MIKLDETFTPHTYEYLVESYEKRRVSIAGLKNPLHRKIGRNYLLHSLLEVSGYYEEILSPELTVAEPEYTFHHTGVELKGHDAVEGMYKDLSSAGSNVIVTTGHLMAVADWGFATEQVNHFNRGGEQIARLGLPPVRPGDIYVEHRQTMRVWSYNSKGLLLGETLYYAHDATYSYVPKELALTAEGTAERLHPLIKWAREDYFSELV